VSTPSSVIPRLAQRAEGSRRYLWDVPKEKATFDIEDVMDTATLALRDPSAVFAARDDRRCKRVAKGRL
jgi:hypothetical protein